MLGEGVRERLVPERSNLRFELAEKEERCEWGGEEPSLDLDGALLCSGHLDIVPVPVAALGARAAPGR